MTVNQAPTLQWSSATYSVNENAGSATLTVTRAGNTAAQAVVHYSTSDGTANPQQVFLLGFSQSCALNYRFAFTHPDRLRGVIGICGGLPGDWDTGELYQETDGAVFHLAGENDEFYPPSRVSNYPEQLRKRAPDVSFRSYDAGHEIVQSMRDDVRVWLRERSIV